MTTLSWIIERLLVKPTEGDKTNVVITADWRCNGVDGKYSGTCYGGASFAPPSGSFTPYKDLTQQQVLDWCFANGVNKTAIEANVNKQIADQINPPIIAPPLPWLNGTTSSAPKLRDEQIVDPLNLPTSDVPPSVDGMSGKILG
jgi:hypothetical protein